MKVYAKRISHFLEFDMTLIDTHAHLFLEEFNADLESASARAAQEGVEKILMPNLDSSSIEAMLATEQKNASCLPMIGIHPCYVKENFEEELSLIESRISTHKFYAVGEAGLDLYWDRTFWKEQQEAFRFQVQLAKKHKLPLSIHCREAVEEAIEIVSNEHDSDLKGVFHCFSGNGEQARRIIEMNFCLGIGGVLTFKNSGLDKALAGVSLDALVLETDAPYLAPAPHRGKRNEPAYLILIAQRLADIYKIPVSEVADITTQNAKRLFAL